MISLYIHVPFCRKKCRYCDFVSYEDSLCFADEYVNAIIKEAQNYNGEKVATVFIGGGTPSLLSISQIDALVKGIGNAFDVSCCKEFTIEANPESITDDKLKAYCDLGVNRISIGLQSALDSELKMLGRIHTFDQFLTAYEKAQKRFSNINIDLISALPGQTARHFISTLDTVTALKPQHLSVYSLIPEDGTPLMDDLISGKLVAVDDEADREIYCLTRNYLRTEGYERYEISNYSIPGYECKHNLTYWTGGDYVGLGCAAHSLYNGERSDHAADIHEYILDPTPKNKYKVTLTDLYQEFIMLRLRLAMGFSLTEFNNIFGYDFYLKNKNTVDQLIKLELAQIKNGRFSLTDRGFDVCDSIILKFI